MLNIFFFQVQAVILGLFIVSGTFADVAHLKNVKPCYKTETQNLKDIGDLASASDNHANVAYSHPSAYSFGDKLSTPAPFVKGIQPTPAPVVFKSSQFTIAPFAYSGSSSAPASFSYGTQPTPAPFQFRSLQSTPAPLIYSGPLFAPEDSFKSISEFYSHSTPTTFALESQSTPAPIAFSDSSSSPVVTVKSHGTIGSQPTPAPFEHSTLSSTLEDSFKSITVSYSQSTPTPFVVKSQSTAVPFTFNGLSSSPAVSVKSFNTLGSHPIPAQNSYSQGSAFAQYEGHSASSPAHEITINREIPVPYYVQIEKRIPYPVLVHVPHP